MRKIPLDIEQVECIPFSGKGHFDFETYDLFAGLEGSEIELESNILLAFNVDGVEIISYTSAIDMSTSLKNQFSDFTPVIGVSVINTHTGLLTPIWGLDETIRNRIQHFFEDFQVSMSLLSRGNALDLDLSINEFVEKLDIEKMLKIGRAHV